ncbi:MAG: histidyl-tRNA synthetase HisS [Saliniramus fredricksonii]|uniref:Histidine--tRNA ligase n=1 Tax=Saliniramus fredricksonii TaxID=1653334 RepID=A0A0P7X9Q6_9HYPH|nr:HisS family protein [Saliniramus fredricksonii]KPQ11956.1 MAG: histidyl-tRNA synthetase HisS [Saliniramus fredricksonii]SCC81549.1 histidyl-tRNA synthetase [Saliniramus fredricksonii]
MSNPDENKPAGKSKADKKKSDKLKARLPRGLTDRGPQDLAASHRMLEKIREVYELYGFEAVETPLIEYTDALGKFLPDQDRPNEGVFSFQDDDEQWLSLRYDLTAPLARYVAENFDALPKPYRSYRSGWVFRNEKPGPGRFRQFMQFDADTVGAPSVAADAEICMMAADTMEALGLSGQYVIKVNNRKILDGVMEAVGLSGEDQAARRLIVLRAIDKFDRLGARGVEALLGGGRKDESGDFTAGAELGTDAIDAFLRLLDVDSPTDETSGDGFGVPNPYYLPSDQWDNFPDVVSQAFDSFNYAMKRRERSKSFDRLGAVARIFKPMPSLIRGLEELEELADLIAAAGYSDKVVIDPSVVRGLEYYTGPVFEAELTFQVTNEDGVPVRFGSVGGGGRYDGLVGRFRSEPVPATGFSIGVSRLLAALQLVDSPILKQAALRAPVVVMVMERERIADYQKFVAALRRAGIRAELYLGSSGMKAQMKYADRRGAPCVIIQGSDERERGEVQIKDLIEGAKAAAAIETNEEWRAARPAQFSVAEADMVEAVRDVLAQHS